MFLWLIFLVILVLVLSKGGKEMFATSPGTLVQLATSSPYHYYPYYGYGWHNIYRHGIYDPYWYNSMIYHPSARRRWRRRRRILRRPRPWWRRMWRW